MGRHLRSLSRLEEICNVALEKCDLMCCVNSSLASQSIIDAELRTFTGHLFLFFGIKE